MNAVRQITDHSMDAAAADALKQFMGLLVQQNMGDQSQDFMKLFRYVLSMQIQLGVMAGELQGIREQLSQLQENQPKPVKEKIIDAAVHFQEKSTSMYTNVSESLSAAKNHLVGTAVQAVNTFKEKGKTAMCGVLQKGISDVKAMLAGCREQLVKMVADCEKTAMQVDRIGGELKQIGNSASNVGRLLTGKDTKEVSGEKPGVGLTRAVTKRIKGVAEGLQKNVSALDRALERLDRLSDRLGGRVSVEAKLSHKLLQIQEKADQQKDTPEQDKAKIKNLEEVCK